MNGTLNDVLDVLIVVLPWIFIAIYSLIAPWWRNLVSRAICTLMVTISLIPMAKFVALVGDITIKHGHGSLYTWLEVYSKLPVVPALAWCVYVLVRLQFYKKNGTLESKKNLCTPILTRSTARGRRLLSVLLSLPTGSARSTVSAGAVVVTHQGSLRRGILGFAGTLTVGTSSRATPARTVRYGSLNPMSMTELEIAELREKARKADTRIQTAIRDGDTAQVRDATDEFILAQQKILEALAV